MVGYIVASIFVIAFYCLVYFGMKYVSRKGREFGEKRTERDKRLGF